MPVLWQSYSVFYDCYILRGECGDVAVLAKQLCKQPEIFLFAITVVGTQFSPNFRSLMNRFASSSMVMVGTVV